MSEGAQVAGGEPRDDRGRAVRVADLPPDPLAIGLSVSQWSEISKAGSSRWVMALGAIVAAAMSVVIFFFWRRVGVPGWMPGWGRFTVVYGSMIATGLVISIAMQYRYVRRRSREVVSAYLRLVRCPACVYDLSKLSPEGDGCTVCPECGAAWRLDSKVVG